MTFTTKYQPEYCKKLIDVMSEGDDVDGVASALNVSRKTIYNWKDAHPEFAEAWEVAHAHYHHWWKRLGREYIITVPPDIKFDTALYMINMRNRCGWLATDPKEKAADAQESMVNMLAQALGMVNKAQAEVDELKGK